MTHAPLFAGINGFGIAADRMGWAQPFHCEIDSFCQRVIKHYWPNSKPFYDIKKADFTEFSGSVDVLSGGFPCQPFSVAGEQLGIEDPRHLWPEMLRAVREIKPRWIVGENVHGLINWGGGLVFEQVQIDLENEGYEVQPYILPAVAKNANHRRDRVWFVAYAIEFGTQSSRRMQSGIHKQTEGYRDDGDYRIIDGRLYGNTCSSPRLLRGNDGVPFGLDLIPFSKWRCESIKGYGNAIDPNIAHEIFKAIEHYELSFSRI